MGTLHLIRHGQASFGADDYDQLSPLGRRQAVRLGEYFRAKGISFEAALVGTLRRHVQTFEGIVEGLEAPLQPLAWPGLNEYDAAAVIGAFHTQPLAVPDTPELIRHHFRLLRDGLARWMRGQTQPVGMPSYADFLQGVTSALDHVRSQYAGDVLLVSSGGPIATAVGHVLGTSAETTIELNLRIRNCSVTEFAFTPRRHMLLSYNGLPHFEHPDCAGWATYT
ncbi:histidine phosphatase family protein [Aquincola tertiaricarbonis]|uniref:histidine phosphatase family protein n=1 Tax=Aquincola tertiaricarbonis TaxID=391953 RepID=UPI000614AE89|nr:histidine phosphatase family protein [Aquincola tertiaricarbonis]